MLTAFLQWNRRLAFKRMYKTYCWLFCCVCVCESSFSYVNAFVVVFFSPDFYLSQFRAIAEQQPLPFNILAKRPQTSSGTGAGAITENKQNKNSNNKNKKKKNNSNRSRSWSSSNWIAKLALPTVSPRPQWQPLRPLMTTANNSSNMH